MLRRNLKLCVTGVNRRPPSEAERFQAVPAANGAGMDRILDANDLVICQTGGISHNAYWRVKDFCKRIGKRCVFVENPSASSLARGLEEFSVEGNDVIRAENADIESAKGMDR